MADIPLPLDLTPGRRPVKTADPRDPGVPLWWMSFTDPDKCDPTGNGKPGGPGFLGVIVTQAATLADAVTGTHLLGINPGGQIGVMGPMPAWAIAPQWRDRLLTKAEAEAIPDPTVADQP